MALYTAPLWTEGVTMTTYLNIIVYINENGPNFGEALKRTSFGTISFGTQY